MRQVRKIKPTRRSISGSLPFNGQSIQYESSLERDFLISHAFREDVINIIAQPITIPFTKNGRTYPYTPDFFIEFNKESNKFPLIVEVKPKLEWQANWREWSGKWKTAISFCRQNNYRFRIYDEDRIRHKALENINYLNRFRHFDCEEVEKNTILEYVALKGFTNIDYLVARFYMGSLENKRGLKVINHLIATKKLRCNLFEDLNEFTEIWVGEK